MNWLAFFQNGKLQDWVQMSSETLREPCSTWAAAGVQSVHSTTRLKVGQVNRNNNAKMTTRGGCFSLHNKQWQGVSASVWSSLLQVSALKHATAETWAATAAMAPCPGTPVTRPHPEQRGAPFEGMPASRSLMCEIGLGMASARTSAADGTSWAFSFYGVCWCCVGCCWKGIKFKTVSTFEMGQDSLYRLLGIRETLKGSYTEQSCYFSIIVCVVLHEPKCDCFLSVRGTESPEHQKNTYKWKKT